MHNISLADIQLLARHLVYWRRARAIPPLHQRDTYIVSPNADMSKLEMASRLYEATFPTLPGLPKILSILSGTPRPYASLIPTKDHKEMYFLILAWLLRGGWVTQLRTFARIKVNSGVKERARSLMNARDLASETQISLKAPNGQSPEGDVASNRARNISDASHSSNRNNGQFEYDEDDFETSLILRPQRASPLESRWIEQIQKDMVRLYKPPHSLSEDEVRELQEQWLNFTKFFNGHDALEKIPVREGLKRKKVWNLLGKLGVFERGVGDEGKTKILVAVRHW